MILQSLKTEVKDEEYFPTLEWIEVSNTGIVKIFFSEELLPQSPLALDRGLHVAIHSDTDIPEEKKRFHWRTLSSAEDQMTIKVDFADPLYISGEGKSNLDRLEITVLNSFLFRAKADLEMVPRGTKVQGKIPVQMIPSQQP